MKEPEAFVTKTLTNIPEPLENVKKTNIFAFDKTQLLKLLELSQYTVVYTLLILPIGRVLNNYLPELDKSKTNIRILLEIVIQMIVIVLTMYFIRRVVKRLPFIYHDPDYEEGGVTEVYGELTIAFVYVVTQDHLAKKILYFIGGD